MMCRVFLMLMLVVALLLFGCASWISQKYVPKDDEEFDEE